MDSNQTQTKLQEPGDTRSNETLLPAYLAYVGINEAARLVSKGKTQIYRDIEAGKLSWHIEDDGKKTLQIADLDRVYKLKSQRDTGNDTLDQNHLLPQNGSTDTTPQSTETAIKIAVLEAELKAKDAALKRMEDEVKDLRQNRDKQLETIQRLTMILPVSPMPSAEIAQQAAPRKPYWKIFG